MSKKHNMVLGVLVALNGVACTSSPNQGGYQDKGKGTTVVSAGGTRATKSTLHIPVSVEYGGFALSGTPADEYDVLLDDCISLYTVSVDETNLDGIEVYKDDRNCLAKLTSLKVGANTYTPTNAGASDFATWAANDTALFASAGGDLMRVKVISQLPSRITGVETVLYNFSELKDATGDYTYGEAEVSDPHLITVESQQAPHFNIVSATYVGVDPDGSGVNGSTGAPQFRFKLECVDDPTAVAPTSVGMTAGSAADTLCGANDLNAISYKLVIDPANANVITITDAETIFSTPGTSVTVPTDQYHDSNSNEGFMTVVLDGPGPLGTAGNQHMLLVVKADLSYTYYNIDVTTITQ